MRLITGFDFSRIGVRFIIFCVLIPIKLNHMSYIREIKNIINVSTYVDKCICKQSLILCVN